MATVVRPYLWLFPGLHLHADEVQILLVQRLVFFSVLALLAPPPLLLAGCLLVLVLVLIGDETSAFLHSR
jgi:hypothetical protein